MAVVNDNGRREFVLYGVNCKSGKLDSFVLVFFCSDAFNKALRTCQVLSSELVLL